MCCWLWFPSGIFEASSRALTNVRAWFNSAAFDGAPASAVAAFALLYRCRNGKHFILAYISSLWRRAAKVKATSETVNFSSEQKEKKP
jgi:hypothetical protein